MSSTIDMMAVVADQIREATAELNRKIEAAAEMGLRTEIHVIRSQRMAAGEVPTLVANIWQAR